jgi:redox-sensitive bicupin YhaK (pirin superfamily)
MSVSEANQPVFTTATESIELVVQANAKDLGGFTVSRVLPAPERMTVGPFIFFDEMGPAQFPPGEGMNVRPHPHIGLATVTYLFAGTIMHRDSLGYALAIEPGAINLMTAGRGIVHSERTPPELLAAGQFLHGIQTWMALPGDREEMDPGFVHYPAESLPVHQHQGVHTTVIIGEAYGKASPVSAEAQTLYLEQRLDAGSTTTAPQTAQERGVYVVGGELQIGDRHLTQGQLAILRPGDVHLRAATDCHLMIVGGEPIGERHLKWNFVHSSAERILQAGRDWVDGKYPGIDGDSEFIPLPEDFFS